MNAAPNRVRLLRDSAHCHGCSEWTARVYGGEIVRRRAHNPGYRVANPNRHGRVKPKGQHVYRRHALSLLPATALLLPALTPHPPD